MASLAGKNIIVMGGSGYVGGAFIKRAAKLGINVTAVSRRGQTPDSLIDPHVTYVKGDATNPESLRPYFEKADAVFHTIGTLVDSVITDKKQPGDIGNIQTFFQKFP